MRKVNKRSLFFTSLTAAALLLAACGTDDSDPIDDGADTDEGTEEGTDTEGAQGGDLIIGQLSDAVSLDPHGSNDTPSSNVAYNIYEALLIQDENMELQPGLATEWEMVDDLTWQFTLREDVTFHDGSEFNADVVQANFERILDEEIASPRAFLYEMVEEINVVDDYTVEFVTEYPFSPLPAHIAHNGGGLMSAEVIAEDYEAIENGSEPGSVINENPVGTGPFVFESWTPGDEIVLNRNEDYWGGAPALDSITFRVVPEGSTRLADLETGAIHISDPLSPSDVSRVEGTDGMSVNSQPSVGLSYIGFNAQKEPFDDPLVRQAISKAIDKDTIINGIYDGVGLPAESPLAPDVFGYDENVSGLEYNVEEARELLAEAGYEDGFSTTLWTNDNQDRIDTATAVQAQLQEIGIDVEIEQVEWGAYLEDTAAGEHDMFILGWTTVTGDADYGMYPLFHSDNYGEAGNRTFFSTDELDSLLEEARQSSDEDERLDLYSRAQEILVDEAPMLYIHHQEFLLAVSDDVEGLWQHPTGILMLRDVSLNQ
ncbi:glutathione ABC transporter substrate-binding protein [Alkalibacterium pelagium]|jgi:peptide/nickel transport system substrate-binding protein|uniref:Peptide/nickel transport system substrate-binding protein n=1 Tax=Alkalibacterium pelagium TaxID=426702 RepID=A0A1H7IKG0_9LACT|nr:glutathione ABC transporter substrate-binding protein [Alkalibacterium pelagium]GEN50095.1 glutathione ABC transporter substrate-binding protein [Alkalibacterium pelagium]SEK62050.1 peptide/nickel transport system substrate-binding protein [Alkalibacterium pelagium]